MQAGQENTRLTGSLRTLNATVGGLLGELDSLQSTALDAKLTIEAYSVAGGRKNAVQQMVLAEKGREQQIGQLLAEIKELKTSQASLVQKLQAAGTPAGGAAASAASPPAAAAVGGGRWLTIGIPTVARKGDLDYLAQTIEAIKEQLPTSLADPFYGKVLVIVLNNRPGGHKVFDDQKRKTEASAYAVHFRFVEKAVQQTDSSKNREGDANVPGSPVRVQTRAVISLLREASGTAANFIFMEDDFLLCPHGLRLLHYLIAKVHAYMPNGFSGIRVSYGLCGIVLDGGDVDEVASYLEQHQDRRPPDHLLPEWTAAETKQAQEYLKGRRNVGYRFNIFNHIGSISTLRASQQVRLSWLLLLLCRSRCFCCRCCCCCFGRRCCCCCCFCCWVCMSASRESDTHCSLTHIVV